MGGTSISWQLHDPAPQVQVVRQWNASRTGMLPDTLLGPEGSGASPLHGPRKSVSDFTNLPNHSRWRAGAGPSDEPPVF